MSADPVPGAPRDLTPAEVQTIRALAEKATPGPWHTTPPYGTTWIGSKNPYGHGLMHIADVRGWGHLTGVGACNLSPEKAAEIQDATAAFIAALSPDVVLALCRMADAQPQGRTGQTCGTCRHWLPTSREADYRAQCNMGVSGSTAEKAAHHPYPITARVFGCNLHESLPVSSRPATGERE